MNEKRRDEITKILKELAIDTCMRDERIDLSQSTIQSMVNAYDKQLFKFADSMINSFIDQTVNFVLFKYRKLKND